MTAPTMPSADTILRHTAVLVEIERLADELLTASQKYRAAKRRFNRRTEVYVARYGQAEAELHARGDHIRQRAGVDCGWHGDEMTRLGTALTALTGVLERTGVDR
jgi:hypothetical protein